MEFTTELTFTETVTEIVLVGEESYDIRTHAPSSGGLKQYTANSNVSLSQGVDKGRTLQNGSGLYMSEDVLSTDATPTLATRRPSLPKDSPETLIALTEAAWGRLGFTREAMDSPLGEFFKYYSVFPYADETGFTRTWVSQVYQSVND